MKVCIIGTGYVGLPTGLGLCSLGHKVTCVDTDIKKVAMLSKGQTTLFEPSLNEMLKEHLKSEAIRFTDSYAIGMRNAEVVIIAVGTPTAKDGKSADLKYIKEAAKEVALHLPSTFTAICVKSTVPVGTNDIVERIIQRYALYKKFAVVSMPEFLREGCAIKDFFFTDRIIIGTDSKWAMRRISKLYEKHPAFKYFVSRKSAELIKYASNAFLAIKINYINEIANLCEKCGANVNEVAKGMGLDRRIGPLFLQPGIGFGGSCFPKDTKALTYTAKQFRTSVPLVEVAIYENEYRALHLAHKIRRLIAKDKKLAILGLTFKADTDDCRESQAIKIVEELAKTYKSIKVYDPKGMENAKKLLGDSIVYDKSIEGATEKADAVIILTGWKQFKTNWGTVLNNIKKSAIIIDYVNLLSEEKAKGHRYYCVGNNKKEL